MLHKHLLLVTGVPRSGTSALTRVLSLCGGTLPQAVLGPRDLNPSGFWEPVDAVRLNHEFLARHYKASIDQMVRLQANIVCDRKEKEEFVRKIQEFLRMCPQHEVLLIKENDISIFMEPWLEAANREGFAVKLAISVRHPHEVLASWIARGGANPAEFANVQLSELERISLIWLSRSLILERSSRDVPRIFVNYASLVNDWRLEVARASRELAIDLITSDSAVDGFLNRDLYRQRSPRSTAELFTDSWTSRAYAIFSAAAADRALEISALEEISVSYRTDRRVPELLNQLITMFNPQQLVEGLSRLPIWRAGQDF